ncbi:adenylate kinase family protein [Methanobrevibacter sp. TMH8]|uniref:adenylate kinase family protein n=1 Tax=Methanobrevibacter sp. TMH8 TaxID=2848611 RepID=UPI001CCA6670|nr:adenylate kinase family protein [Methanobrevibacter sp. TMH8]
MNNINNIILFITGTPGVGKTTIADNLNGILNKKYDSKLIKINELAIENNLIKGKDLEKGYKIVDIDKLSKKLNKTIDYFFSDDDIPKIVIVEGHLSHLCSIEINKDNTVNHIFKVIVLRLNPNILQKRLNARDYSEDKIHENLEAEALGVCSVEAYENHGNNVNEINTTNLEVKDILSLVESILFDEKQFPVGDVDFMQWILD